MDEFDKLRQSASGAHEKGYIWNCFLHPRRGDGVLFTEAADGSLRPHLNGYAIIPIEEFNRLARAVGEHTCDDLENEALEFRT